MAVRREKVILDLESNLPEGMLRGAAATQVLRMELERLSGASVRSSRVSRDVERDIDKVSVVATKADKSINQLTGRLRLFADVAAILGPALVPLGGVAIAGVAGLASQMGVAAVAGGVLIGSMQGLGDALSALNDAHLEPTAENLNKVDEALSRLSPAAADFAREAYAMLPALRAIRDAGAEGLFPGLTDSLDDLERLTPVVANIFGEVGAALGEIASDSAASLASERWADFFEFIADEAPSALSELASTVGSLTRGMAELWMAFTPLNRDFSSWLMDVADGFDSWATGLAQTEGFRGFVDYIRETGPQVSETLGALANALVQIVQAAAPLGGPILQAIEAAADVLAAIANSSAGPVLFSAAAGFAAFSRAMAGYEAIKGTKLVSTLTGISTNADGAAKGLSGFNKAALGLAGLTVAFVALDELNKRLDETLPGLETLKGQLIDLANVPTGFSAAGLSGEFNSLAESIERISNPDVTDGVQGVFDAIAPGDNRAASLREATAEVAALDSALAALVTGGNADVAEQALANLADQYGLSASQVKRLMGMLPGYNEALQAEANNADLAADSTSGLADATADATRRTNTFKDALTRLNNVLDGRSNMRDYEAAIDDFTAAIKKNGNTFDITTKKGRENQGMLDAIVGSTLAVAEGMRGANRQKFLTSAIADLGTMADRMDLPKSEVARLIELLKRANNTNVNPTIGVDTNPAMRNIAALEAKLRAIKDEDVFVNVRQIGSTTLGPRNEAANGTFVPKTGKPYADRHLYLLADGEGVTTNRRGETDRFRDVITGINKGYSRSAIKGMLAGGGVVGKDKKAEEARERARRAAEERKRREEEKRQRQLDRQRTKDLLASNLRDEQEQARLEVIDARRRLKSARKAGRPKDEIREARLALKGERADVRDMRDQRRADAEAERTRKAEEEEAERTRIAEEAARRQREIDDAILDGQTRAWQQAKDAAQAQVDASKAMVESVQANMDRIGQAATAGFSGSWFSGGEQRRGLWTGPGGGAAGDWRTKALGDISGLRERGSLISRLSSLGLSGAALEDLLGNQSNAGIAEMIASGEIADFNALFSQRQQLLASVSAQAGRAGYGSDMAAANAQLATMNAQFAALTAAIEAARPITVLEAISAQETARELARLLSMTGGA